MNLQSPLGPAVLPRSSRGLRSSPTMVGMRVLAQLRRSFVENELHREMVLSSSLLGMPMHRREQDRVLDLDIVTLVRDDMNARFYGSLERVLEGLQDVGTGDVGVAFAVRDGPMKLHLDKRHTVFIHFLLHTPASLTQSPLIVVKNSWFFDARSPLTGTRLQKLLPTPDLSIPTLRASALGLQDSVIMLERRVSGFLEWRFDSSGKGAMLAEQRSLEDAEDRIEFALYTILRGASNFLRSVHGYPFTHIDDAMVAAFASCFSQSRFALFPRKALTEKRHVRSGRRIPSATAAEAWMERAYGFVSWLHRVALATELGAVTTG